MERLSGIDASFLYMETPTVHMHTIKVAVMDPAPHGQYSLEAVKRDLGKRLHLLPMFRRRAIEVPLRLHHPVWIEDAEFDLDRHLRILSVASPGGPREMDAAISEIASVQLTRDKPLWELSILHGLAGGCVACVGKIHHTVADGVAVAQMLANVMDAGTAAAGSPIAATTWKSEPFPSRRRLVWDALRDHLQQLRRFPALAGRTARNLVAVARDRRSNPFPPPRPLLDVARTSINGALTARRRFVSLSLPLETVKAAKNALGVSVNDLLLALVSGSLRRYLARRNEVPARPLLAEVPMALDLPGEPRRLAGNRVSNLFTSLCTDEVDPVTRVRKIHEAMAVAKRANEILGPQMYRDWSEYAPPGPFSCLMRLYSRARLANRIRPAINVIISSVPGPPSPLRWENGSLRSIYSVGPLIEGTALNVTAWSYVDQFNIGVLACPDLVEQPDEIADGLRQELDALLAATSYAVSA